MKITYILIALSLLLTNCKKDNDSTFISKQELIIGKWTFVEKPPQNLNNYQGHIEDRTVFSGDETLTYDKLGVFKIDSIDYGNWLLESTQTRIQINITKGGGYPPLGCPQSAMTFDIVSLNDSLMIVNHWFYKFQNTYKFKKN